MPNLLAFVLCERILVDQHSRQVSLIDLFDQFRLATDQPDVLNMVALRGGGAFFTLWDCEPEDAGKAYLQRVELVAPDGTRIPSPPVRFVPEGRISRVIFNIPELSVGRAGLYFFEAQYRLEDAPDDGWQTLARHPLEVTHTTIPTEIATDDSEMPQPA